MEKLFKKILRGIYSLNGTDAALIMASVGAAGLLVGTNIGNKNKKTISVISVFLFIVTAIPVISKITGKMLNNDFDEYFSDNDCFEPEE